MPWNHCSDILLTLPWHLLMTTEDTKSKRKQLARIPFVFNFIFVVVVIEMGPRVAQAGLHLAVGLKMRTPPRGFFCFYLQSMGIRRATNTPNSNSIPEGYICFVSFLCGFQILYEEVNLPRTKCHTVSCDTHKESCFSSPPVALNAHNSY